MELINSGSPVVGQTLYVAGKFCPELLTDLLDPNLFLPSNAGAIDCALLDAARTGRATDITRFLKLVANPETGDYYHGRRGWNSLHLICEKADWDGFQALFAKHFDIFRLTNDGQTALMIQSASEGAIKNPGNAAKIREQIESRAKN